MNTVYEEGLHIIFPWDIMFPYNIRVQEETQDLNVLTRDGLTVSIQISIRYQLEPDRLPILHKQIGPDYHRKIIIPIINAAVRQTVGAYHPRDLYSTALQSLHDQILIDLVDELGSIPIIIHGVVVKNLRLPQVLGQAIEKKLIAEQDYLRYKYLILEAEQEAKRKFVEGAGINAFQALVNKNMTAKYLQYEGVKATKELANSNNSKMVIIGGGQGGLPVILNPDAPTGENKDPNTVKAQNKSKQKPSATPQKHTENKSKTQKTNNNDTQPIDRESLLDMLERLDRTILSNQ